MIFRVTPPLRNILVGNSQVIDSQGEFRLKIDQSDAKILIPLNISPDAILVADGESALPLFCVNRLADKIGLSPEFVEEWMRFELEVRNIERHIAINERERLRHQPFTEEHTGISNERGMTTEHPGLVIPNEPARKSQKSPQIPFTLMEYMWQEAYEGRLDLRERFSQLETYKEGLVAKAKEEGLLIDSEVRFEEREAQKYSLEDIFLYFDINHGRDVLLEEILDCYPEYPELRDKNIEDWDYSHGGPTGRPRDEEFLHHVRYDSCELAHSVGEIYDETWGLTVEAQRAIRPDLTRIKTTLEDRGLVCRNDDYLDGRKRGSPIAITFDDPEKDKRDAFGDVFLGVDTVFYFKKKGDTHRVRKPYISIGMNRDTFCKIFPEANLSYLLPPYRDGSSQTPDLPVQNL